MTNLPTVIAATSPLGEVARGQGASAELGSEDSADLRRGVKPVENGAGLLAIAKALVDLFADGMRETSDFSVTSA